MSVSSQFIERTVKTLLQLRSSSLKDCWLGIFTRPIQKYHPIIFFSSSAVQGILMSSPKRKLYQTPLSAAFPSLQIIWNNDMVSVFQKYNERQETVQALWPRHQGIQCPFFSLIYWNCFLFITYSRILRKLGINIRLICWFLYQRV